jgi:hypothetical protein
VSTAARRALRRVLGAALGALGLLVAVTPLAWPADAQPARPGDGPAGTAAAVASSLRGSPLYVDPDMAWMFPAAAQRQVLRAIRTSPVHVFVVAVPFDIDDDMPDYAGYYLDQLYRQTHQSGVYLSVGPSGFITDAEYEIPRDIALPESVEIEQADSQQQGQIAANTPGRILSLIHAIATSTPDAGAAGSPTPFYTPTAAASGFTLASGGPSAAAPIAAGIAAFVLAGPLLALTGFGITRAGRGLAADRRGWGDAGDPGTPAGHMPTSPDAGWLRRHADGELAALARVIAAGSDASPGWQRACEDYDAGMLARNSRAEPIDLVGAIVLARDGRLALAWGTAQPPPPCLVNPLHGRSVVTLPPRAWTLPGQSRLEVPVCARCARDFRRPRSPDPGSRLLKVEHNGARTYYLGFGSVWRDRLFGASGAGLPQAIREHLGVS